MRRLLVDDEVGKGKPSCLSEKCEQWMKPSGSGCRLLVGWWRQSAVESQAYPRPASRGAFLVFLAEPGAQKSAASDRDPGRDQWQPGHLVLGRGQPGRSHQPDTERRGHSGDLCSAEP